ncbi:MAG: hypothetical protein D6719_05890 [Candidatus Dadabacteria bacterium]|nr:MAG: hypothetical protein D6719_05890 [Candidatus Dadabacteria bacterium]
MRKRTASEWRTVRATCAGNSVQNITEDTIGDSLNPWGTGSWRIDPRSISIYGSPSNVNDAVSPGNSSKGFNFSEIRLESGMLIRAFTILFMMLSFILSVALIMILSG